MYDKGIFVFGSSILPKEVQRDAVTSLPLEISWKIFSYLDDTSLRIASKITPTWARIITSNTHLRKRLKFLELSIKLGSKSLAKFHRRNVKKMKKEIRYRRNYLQCGESLEQFTTVHKLKSKRKAEDVIVHTKRFKLS